MNAKRTRRDIPLRKIIPNMITSGNVLCGMLALVLSFHGHFVPASWLILVAVFFDFMDGKMARSLGGSSAFGLELDSLADVVSFGAAPAMILYGTSLKGFLGVTGALVASFFALCGALRLARFNVTTTVTKPGFFQGLPIPAAGLFIVSFVLAGVSLPQWTMALVVLGAALLMVSSFPYGNLKKLRKGNLDRIKAGFLTLCTVGLCALLREKALLALLSVYVTGGFFGFDWGKWLSRVADVEKPEEKV